jgi:hypothetical protein
MSHIWPIWPVYSHRGKRSLPFWLAGCRSSSVSYWPTVGSGTDRKIRQPPPPIDVNWGRIQVFLTLPGKNGHMTHPTPSSCAITLFFRSSKTNYFNLFIFVLCVTYFSKLYENDIIAYTKSILKKLDQLILDMCPSVLSHMWPIWPAHMSSEAGQDYG